jgi:hypothetical protein
MEPSAIQFALFMLLLLVAIAIAILWANPAGWLVSATVVVAGLIGLRMSGFF